MNSFIQIWLLAFSCAAIWLVGRLESWKKWGYVCGLLSQPAWFYTSYQNEQYGIMLLAAWYTYAWGQGFYNYWIRRK